MIIFVPSGTDWIVYVVDGPVHGRRDGRPDILVVPRWQVAVRYDRVAVVFFSLFVQFPHLCSLYIPRCVCRGVIVQQRLLLWWWLLR